jgi:hypothetical protein
MSLTEERRSKAMEALYSNGEACTRPHNTDEIDNPAEEHTTMQTKEENDSVKIFKDLLNLGRSFLSY